MIYVVMKTNLKNSTEAVEAFRDEEKARVCVIKNIDRNEKAYYYYYKPIRYSE